MEGSVSLNRGKIGFNKHLVYGEIATKDRIHETHYLALWGFVQLDKNGTKTRVVRDFY
jgi:hypothetical protein